MNTNIGTQSEIFHKLIENILQMQIQTCNASRGAYIKPRCLWICGFDDKAKGHSNTERHKNLCVMHVGNIWSLSHSAANK